MKTYRENGHQTISGPIISMRSSQGGKIAVLQVPMVAGEGDVERRDIIFIREDARRVIEEVADSIGEVTDLSIELEAETTTIAGEFIRIDSINRLEISWEGNDKSMKAIKTLINQE